MITLHRLHRSSLVALLFVGCSPDLSLLSDQASFAGTSSGGSDSEPTAGSAAANGGSGGSSGGGSAPIGDAGSEPAGGGEPMGGSEPVGGAESTGGSGAGPDMPPADGGAAGTPSTGPGVTTTFEKDLPLLGDSTGGAPFTDDCKDGEALAGVGVTTGAFLSQIHGICRRLSLAASPNAALGYQVKLTGDRALPAHPSASQDTAVSLACPEDEALVGVRLAEQHYDFGGGQTLPVIVRIWVTCAKLVLLEVDGQLGIGWAGPKELAPASGSFANGTAFLVSAMAPNGLVASRLLGASGSWVDRVGFGVSQLGVVAQ